MLFEHVEEDLRLRVQSMSWESESVLSVCLRALDESLLPSWRPGAHIDLHLPADATSERVLIRQFSLSGAPEDRSHWRVTVLREPEGGGGSEYVHDRLRPGDILDVVGPRNNFELHDADEYLFIAGGVGITPILPMIESVERAAAPWRLMYGGRSRRTMAFVAELERHGSKVTVWPQDEHGLLDLDAFLGRPRDGVGIYCCGPEGLLAAVEQQCDSWPDRTLHLERFKPKQQAPHDPDEEQAFEVVLERSGTTLAVPSGMSVLEALENAGIEPLTSCREGICGTCETKVLAGTPDHRDSLLSDEERAEGGTMMICVGRALSEKLVLDL